MCYGRAEGDTETFLRVWKVDGKRVGTMFFQDDIINESFLKFFV